jgi:hypothetical protein
LNFRFETQDVPVPTSAWVSERLDQKRGGWVFGRMGTGKSHAVRKAVHDGIRIDVTAGPLLGQRFAVDLACQLGLDGRPLLETFRNEGLEATLPLADRAVNGHPFMVDGVDLLLPAASSLDDPAATLWQDEKKVLLDWLQGRLDRSPTFLVGRQSPKGVEAIHQHMVPADWPIRLKETPDGFRDWPLLGRVGKGNPAVFTLARALVPLLQAPAFNALVEQASEDEASVPGLLRRLGRAFLASAPPSWQRALSIVGALGEISRDVIATLLHGRADTASGTPVEDESSPLDRLRELKLIEERSGLVSLLPTLADADAIRPLTSHERKEVLPAVARALFAPINDPRTLVPEQADRVLRAHAIFVDLGDMSSAEQTAALHVHGLVDLARRTSLDEHYPEAWRQYDGILRMMQSGIWSTRDRIGKRLLSYVRHYRSLNGARAGALDDATCLGEYQLALASWPENALWHQRTIESLIRLGRPIEATQSVVEAYGKVEEHPRRDELLRVRPAQTALVRGLPLLSLELIEPVLDLPADLYPEVADGGKALLRRWEAGLAISELPFHPASGGAEGRIVFHAQPKVELRRSGGNWTARLHGLAFEAHALSPRAAIEALARQLADETLRLVSTPSSNLGAKDVRRKGRLLSIVDVLNSDIGLEHPTERWIVGRIVGKELIPTMRHLPAIGVPDELLPERTEGLYFARVPVHRDGGPSGPATKLKPAGSGLGTDALLALLASMSEDAA